MDNSIVTEENVVRMFAPDLITPEQHRDRIRTEPCDRPEIRLMIAVMEDAVATLQRYAHDPSARHRRDFEETIDWIDSRDTSWPYSFENVCSALAFEPEKVRLGMRAAVRCDRAGKADVYRFPFRRVNGKRHAITIRDRSKGRRRA
ncbi:hypothetical protein KGQ64_00855 [bacterium]|nr:hypothetical protein [bacterium]